MHISNGSGKTLFIKLIWENVNNKSIEIKGITVLTVLSAIFCRFKTFKIKSWGEIVSFHNKAAGKQKSPSDHQSGCWPRGRKGLILLSEGICSTLVTVARTGCHAAMRGCRLPQPPELAGTIQLSLVLWNN